MVATTPRNALRYAELTDPPNAFTLASNLATDVDDKLITRFTSTTARDTAIPTPITGEECVTTDYGVHWRYTGSAWTLMGTPYFTNEAARDAAIASPQAGMQCLTGDSTMPAGTDLMRWRYYPLGSKWIWDEEKLLYVSSDTSVTGTTYAQVTALTTPTLKASRSYYFEIDLHILATSGTGLNVGLFGPTSCTIHSTAYYWDRSAAVVKTVNNAAIATSANLILGAGAGDGSNHSYARVNGTLINSATAGQAFLAIAQAVNGTASWVLRGTTFKIREIPA